MKKLTKRKMYQKRRKKEKEEKRKTTQRLEKQNKPPVNNNYNISHYQYPQNAYTEGMRQWWKTYYTALQYHRDQRMQWKEASVVNQVQGIYSPTESELLEKYAEEYETSSEEEQFEYNTDKDDGNELEDTGKISCTPEPTDDLDIEYLKFLEITNKHREQLRLKREAEC